MVTPNEEQGSLVARPPVDEAAGWTGVPADVEEAAVGPVPAPPAAGTPAADPGPGTTAAGETAAGSSPPSQDGPTRSTRRSELPVSDIAASTCPLLVSERGAWRGVKPSSDHRCAAETPPGQPSRDHQRAHCLSAEFVACPLYLGLVGTRDQDSRAARSVGGTVVAGGGGRWGLRPTAPIVIEGPPSSLDPRVLVRSRRLGAIALVVLMVAGFALVAFARLPGLLPGGSTAAETEPAATSTAQAATSQPGGVATSSPTTPTASDAGGGASSASPASLPSGSVEAATATPAATIAVTPTAETPSVSPTPSPTPVRTYVVQRGDTLSSIARQFDTTVDAIAAANGITNPSLIGVGQTLIIP